MTQLPPPLLPGPPDPVEIAAAVAIVVSAVGGMIILMSLVRAWLRRLSPGAQGGGAELAELRDEVLGELQQVRHEVAELSERVDFAERMLAKREAEKLPPVS